jgi:hypothetical protein
VRSARAIGDDDLSDPAAELLDHRAQEVMGQGARRLDPFETESDGVGFEDADPDRQEELAAKVAEDDDRDVGRRVQHQPLDLHLELVVRVARIAHAVFWARHEEKVKAQKTARWRLRRWH